MMRALSIAYKSLIELLREPMLLGLMLFFPVVFVGLYYVAFGPTDGGLETYLSILVVNEDAGVEIAEGDSWQAGEELIYLLRQTEWDGEPVFGVEVVTDRRAAEIALQEHKVALLLAIPRDFSQALVDGTTAADDASPAVVSLVGDTGSDSFVFAQGFLTGLVRQFVAQAGGWQDGGLTIAYEFLPGTGTMSDFEFGVAGIIVFGIMFVIVTTATVLVRENVSGTLRRLRLTCASAAEILVGVTLGQMAVAAVQIPMTFGAAVAMGFHCQGSLLLAMGIGMLLNLSAVGLGLIVACFARNDGDAVNLGSGVLVPMLFLSDALYPMPDLPIATVAGRTIQVYDLLPATHAAGAMRRVLIFGEGPAAIAYELVGLTVLSIIILAVGVVLYERMKMRKI
jgi:ABC-2 type transport system permease protein